MCTHARVACRLPVIDTKEGTAITFMCTLANARVQRLTVRALHPSTKNVGGAVACQPDHGHAMHTVQLAFQLSMSSAGVCVQAVAAGCGYWHCGGALHCGACAPSAEEEGAAICCGMRSRKAPRKLAIAHVALLVSA